MGNQRELEITVGNVHCSFYVLPNPEISHAAYTHIASSAVLGLKYYFVPLYHWVVLLFWTNPLLLVLSMVQMYQLFHARLVTLSWI